MSTTNPTPSLALSDAERAKIQLRADESRGIRDFDIPGDLNAGTNASAALWDDFGDALLASDDANAARVKELEGELEAVKMERDANAEDVRILDTAILKTLCFTNDKRKTSSEDSVAVARAEAWGDCGDKLRLEIQRAAGVAGETASTPAAEAEKTSKCPDCDGRGCTPIGIHPYGLMQRCPTCDGDGEARKAEAEKMPDGWEWREMASWVWHLLDEHGGSLANLTQPGAGAAWEWWVNAEGSAESLEQAKSAALRAVLAMDGGGK